MIERECESGGSERERERESEGATERDREKRRPLWHSRTRRGSRSSDLDPNVIRSRPRKVDSRLAGKGKLKSHGARPVHLIISILKWNRTSRLSIKKRPLWHSRTRRGRRSCFARASPSSVAQRENLYWTCAAVPRRVRV